MVSVSYHLSNYVSKRCPHISCLFGSRVKQYALFRELFDTLPRYHTFGPTFGHLHFHHEPLSQVLRAPLSTILPFLYINYCPPTLQLACSGPFNPFPPSRSLSADDSSKSPSFSVEGLAAPSGYSHPSCAVFLGVFQKEVKPSSSHLPRRSVSS